VLLPRFKKLTLAIAEDGIALRETGGAVRLLSKENQVIGSQSIVEVLQQHHALLKGRAIDLVLANKFLRFTVLPWQTGVFSRADWQALASHSFREQYGNVADSWHVKVSLGQAEETVVATAMDQALFEALQAAAKQHQFSWQSITPVAMRLLNQAKRNYRATLIVEPQHLLLCEQNQSQYKDFQVMSPPAGQEAALAKQMLARWQFAQPSSSQQNPAVVYVSGNLKDSWVQESEGVNVVVEMAKQKYQTNASWLTTI